jgi:ribose-phosphate pyrophosphokinase
MPHPPLALFALNSSRAFAELVAGRLGIGLEPHEEREFEDGEHKARPLVGVRGRDVYVMQSLYSDEVQSVNDKLCRLLFFLAALRDAAAARVTAVVPYLAYARKDRRTQPRDPVTTRYMAMLFEASGVDAVVTLDVHNVAAFQNAFRCRTEHLEAKALFVHYLAPMLRGESRVTVVSPDAGGVKRAETFRQRLGRELGRDIGGAFFEKTRAKGELSFGHLRGDVADGVAVIVDDLVSTGSTLAHAAAECRRAGARSVFALATHGLFIGGAEPLFAAEAVDKVIVTDTVPPFRVAPGAARTKLYTLSASSLFAEAIRRMNQDGSVSALNAE